MLFCFVLPFFAACGQQAEKEKTKRELPVKDIRVAEVTLQQVESIHVVTGTVTAIERATISSRVSGVIRDLPVDLGSVVSRGDVLARIDADEIAAQLSQAEARLKQARRSLEREKRLMEKDAATRESVKEL